MAEKKSIEESVFGDGMDGLLVESCEKIENEKVVASHLDDGNDELMNQSYDSVKCIIEKKVDALNLDDGNDDLINKAYDSVRIFAENKMFREPIPQNLQYLVKPSRKEIERNHLLAKVRLSEGKKNWSAKFKSQMADYFASVESWPNYALKLLFSKYFSYNERIAFACFLHGNGLKDGEKGVNIFKFYNSSWTNHKWWMIRFRKFEALFTYLDQACKLPLSDTGIRIRNDYWYYDMFLKLHMYYDGTVRTKTGERRRFYPLFNRYGRYNK